MPGSPRKDLRKTIFKVQEPHVRQLRIHLPNYIAEEAGLKGGDSINYEVVTSKALKGLAAGTIIIHKGDSEK